MKVVGLTGGIACGKSTVSRVLSQAPYKIPIIDADEISHAVMAPGTGAYYKVIKAFAGEDIFVASEGKDAGPSSAPREIDRKKLGDLIFNNDGLKRKLVGIMNPAIAIAIGKARNFMTTAWLRPGGEGVRVDVRAERFQDVLGGFMTFWGGFKAAACCVSLSSSRVSGRSLEHGEAPLSLRRAPLRRRARGRVVRAGRRDVRQRAAGADARQHHDMRRSQRTGRQHYLAAGARLDHPVALPHPDAVGAATFHNQPKRLRAGEDMKVRTPLGGFQEGSGAAAAAAVPHGHLKVTDAFLVFAVPTFKHALGTHTRLPGTLSTASYTRSPFSRDTMKMLSSHRAISFTTSPCFSRRAGVTPFGQNTVVNHAAHSVPRLLVISLSRDDSVGLVGGEGVV